MGMFFEVDGFEEPGWDLFSHNPSLEPYKAELTDLHGVSPGISISRMFVYLAYLVDKSGPLRDYENYKERMQEAAKMAGLEKRHNGSPEWVDEIINGSDYVSRFKMRMLFVQHSSDWSILMTLQGALHKTLIEIDKGDTSKLKDMKVLKAEISDIQEGMNGSEMTEDEKRLSFAILEEESLGIRPEEYIPKYQREKSLFKDFA